MDKRLLCLLFCVFVGVSLLNGQDDSKMSFASAANSKFITMSVLPKCMTVAVQRGDPSKEPAVLLLKFNAGCTVPWHWHTASEKLMLVSGTGKAEMKGGSTVSMHAGDFLYLPAKSVHQFTSVSAVIMFDLPEGAFDIHYVDISGNEIPPAQAFRNRMMVKPAAGPTVPLH